MNGLNQAATRSITAIVCITVAATFAVEAQQPQKPQDDVLRVNTELVQTAVTVVDKNGKFVDGLGREQFELTVDGKPRPVTLLQPGIYQVRVAARDEKSGRVGSAIEWVVIPDLTKKDLTLSSLLLGGQVLDNSANKDGAAQIQLSVDHRFPRSSTLGYWIFVYNAPRDATGNPSLTVKSGIVRDGKLLLAAPLRTIKSGGEDPQRIPFGQQLSLRSLAPGKYSLIVTVTNVVAGNSASERTNFEVW